MYPSVENTTVVSGVNEGMQLCAKSGNWTNMFIGGPGISKQ